MSKLAHVTRTPTAERTATPSLRALPVPDLDRWYCWLQTEDLRNPVGVGETRNLAFSVVQMATSTEGLQGYDPDTQTVTAVTIPVDGVYRFTFDCYGINGTASAGFIRLRLDTEFGWRQFGYEWALYDTFLNYSWDLPLTRGTQVAIGEFVNDTNAPVAATLDPDLYITYLGGLGSIVQPTWTFSSMQSQRIPSPAMLFKTASWTPDFVVWPESIVVSCEGKADARPVDVGLYVGDRAAPTLVPPSLRLSELGPQTLERTFAVGTRIEPGTEMWFGARTEVSGLGDERITVTVSAAGDHDDVVVDWDPIPT